MGSPWLILLEGAKSRGFIAIDKDRNRVVGNAGHDKLGEVVRKKKELGGILDERPFQPVKWFLKVDLEDCIILFSFYFPEVGDELLDNYSIVSSSSPKEKVGLAGANDVVKVGFDSIYNDFGNNFVRSVT